MKRAATSPPDFLADLGLLAATARIKRLSDALGASIKTYYRRAGVDLEPSWHLVLLYLEDAPAPPSRLAADLKLSKPTATKMIQRMAARGYLEVRGDASDGRRRSVRLTRLAQRRLPEFKRLWAAGEAAVGELMKGHEALFRHLDALEARLAEDPFHERAERHLESD